MVAFDGSEFEGKDVDGNRDTWVGGVGPERKRRKIVDILIVIGCYMRIVNIEFVYCNN